MKPIIRRAALIVSAAAVVSTVVQLPVTTPTPPSLALTRAGSVTEVQITGRAGVPANASAVVLNLTALDSSTTGYVTAYACGSPLPNVSNLNYAPGGTAIANSATVPIGTDGKVCLYTSTATNLIADINGYHPAGSTFTTTTPTRLLDTRPSRAGQGAITEVQITGRAGVPANASAVVLNLTALDSSTTGYVTAYACGSPLPNVSNLNYAPGGTAIANSATVPIGTDGKVCLYTSTATNLIADINGYHPAGSTFTTTTPTRLLDTRPSRAGQGAITEVQITGRAGVPANASAVVLNLTALDSSTTGYVTAYACGSPLPNVSNLNYAPGGTAIANSATVPIGTDGKVCLYTSTATNLIADINGYHPAGSTFTTTTPTRLLDTRSAPTTALPTTGQFVETFTGNTGLDRFDTGLSPR
jgi:archaellum component FlaF (FlaF/FlaG flagellin family)